MGQSFVGNKIVLMGKFEARAVWDLVQAEKINSLMITGDAMARPLIEALDEPGASWDTSSLIALSSSAAVFSPVVKDRFFEKFPNIVMVDAIGSSEGGNNGMIFVERGKTEMKGGPTVKSMRGTVVIDDNGKVLQPGSGVVGRLARRGHIPLEYYKDPKKSAQTFVTYDGVRYSIPGDFATVEADGRITLLGRGSVSINSGGEKIFPEEVEAAVKSHPDIYDVTVVGIPDERWGSRVVAVVEMRENKTPDLQAVQDHCRKRIAGYKIPRALYVVDKIERSPSGKPDYPWATRVARTMAGL